MELIGTEIQWPFDHLIVIWIAFITADGLNVTFCQGYFIQFSGLIQLICHIVGFYHFNGNCFKAAAFCIPVMWILGKYLFITLNIGCHGIASVVPHIFVVHRFDTVYTQFIDQALRDWIETGVCTNGIEIWFCFGAMIYQCVAVHYFDSNHFCKLGTFSGIQCICFFLRQAFGIFIVFCCTFDHFHRHRSICRIVLMEVQNPLKSGQEILCSTICLFFSIYINPFYAITNLEGPGKAAIFGAPLLCQCRNQFAIAVCFQQTIPEIGQILCISRCFRIEKVKGCKFGAGNF